MQKSRYNVVVEYEGKWIIYNLLKSSCVILNENEYVNYNSFLEFEGKDTLSELGIYIEDNYNELEEAFYYFRRNTDDRNQNYRKHRIYTTLACNAKCPYCFEQGGSKQFMDLHTAERVSKYILDKQGNAKKLSITWFGGEPLLNTEVIDYVSNYISKNKGADVEFSSFLVTNGLLLDQPLIKKAISNWKLDEVQITLDGLKETYEKTKNFKTKDAFELVIRNIKLLLDSDVKVKIRLNYDLNNYEEILHLIDYLGVNFSQYSNVFVYAYKIFSNSNKDNSRFSSYELDIKILKHLIANGFYKDILESITPNMISCVAGSLYNTMFLPKGDIGKCAQAMADGDIVGNIQDGVNNKKVARWCCGLLTNKCMECKLLPICGGGCLYEIFKGRNGCSTSEQLVQFKLHYYLKHYDK